MQGNELKRLRTAAGLTQAKAAEALGVSPNYLAMMERDEKPIEKRTETMIEMLLRTRLDVSWSDAVKGWIVAVTRPGRAPASREHYLLAVEPDKEAATVRATKELENYPFAVIIIRERT